MRFPATGIAPDQIENALKEYEVNDVPFERVFASTHHLDDVVEAASVRFMEKNYFFKQAFPSCAKLEEEVVSMVGALHGLEQAVGSVTPGGTMSNIHAVLAAREYARKQRPGISEPNIVACETAHPSVDKGGLLMNVKIVKTPSIELAADPAAIETAIDANTIGIFCTAGTANHGVIDPVDELGKVAERHGDMFLHVDACLGGFIIPFAEKLGYTTYSGGWDFSVPAVSSMAVDPHKMGMAAYPTSVQMYRTPELYASQHFYLTNWTGGDYASPGIEGSHSGAGIASAWAAIKFYGQEGYMKLIDTAMKTTHRLHAGVRQIDGLDIVGDPKINVVPVISTSPAFTSYAVAEAMNRKGWLGIGRMRKPRCFRIVIMPHHAAIVDEFLGDLQAAARQAESGQVTAPDAPIYM